MLFCHGNGGNLTHCAHMFRNLHDRMSVDGDSTIAATGAVKARPTNRASCRCPRGPGWPAHRGYCGERHRADGRFAGRGGGGRSGGRRRCPRVDPGKHVHLAARRGRLRFSAPGPLARCRAGSIRSQDPLYHGPLLQSHGTADRRSVRDRTATLRGGQRAEAVHHHLRGRPPRSPEPCSTTRKSGRSWRGCPERVQSRESRVESRVPLRSGLSTLDSRLFATARITDPSRPSFSRSVDTSCGSRRTVSRSTGRRDRWPLSGNPWGYPKCR